MKIEGIFLAAQAKAFQDQARLSCTGFHMIKEGSMVYVTLKQPPHFHQMTLDEFLFGANPNLTTIIK